MAKFVDLPQVWFLDAKALGMSHESHLFCPCFTHHELNNPCYFAQRSVQYGVNTCFLEARRSAMTGKGIQVIVAGLGRTGTLSKEALRILGYIYIYIYDISHMEALIQEHFACQEVENPVLNGSLG